jgi:hypothetical protein
LAWLSHPNAPLDSALYTVLPPCLAWLATHPAPSPLPPAALALARWLADAGNDCEGANSGSDKFDVFAMRAALFAQGFVLRCISGLLDWCERGGGTGGGDSDRRQGSALAQPTHRSSVSVSSTSGAMGASLSSTALSSLAADQQQHQLQQTKPVPQMSGTQTLRVPGSSAARHLARLGEGGGAPGTRARSSSLAFAPPQSSIDQRGSPAAAVSGGGSFVGGGSGTLDVGGVASPGVIDEDIDPNDPRAAREYLRRIAINGCQLLQAMGGYRPHDPARTEASRATMQVCGERVPGVVLWLFSFLFLFCFVLFVCLF